VAGRSACSVIDRYEDADASVTGASVAAAASAAMPTVRLRELAPTAAYLPHSRTCHS
jgi:hypothetical protein